MEVVGPWRQQWAGAAEYGKVVDGVGGVVRTARALEVLQASGPGGRMRVTRAAYHSSGPLSTSFLLHSSTRTILSSGADVLRSPSLVSKPVEVSSIPLDAVSDSCAEGEELYKVTEPDDTDISEPSKWRSNLGRRSLRMPSEESSSTDNASLVDSGGRAYFATSSRRTNSSKTSTTSHSISDAEHKALRSSFHRKSSGPLMKISEHAKCLELSVSKLPTSKHRDEWHDRRNSYGFENSPPNEIKKLSEDDKVGIESSTDSGICKSTEVVNIPLDKYKPNDVHDSDDVGRKVDDRHETFQDWLAKNRSSSSPKTDISSTGMRDNSQINLKSPSKITISLPISSDKDTYNNRESKYNSIRGNQDYLDRKLKKVEFCKTELHFAAESGKVNIIETDEKPPSTNDFRRRRSAFVPIRDQLERPITLFGGTYLNESSTEQSYFSNNENEDDADPIKNEHDNDSAVKSILKNKIPKPKPYLLGEDIEFEKERRRSDDNIWGVHLTRTSDDFRDSNTTRSPISMLNESLKQDHRLSRKHMQEVDTKFNRSIIIERNADRNHCNVDPKERKPSSVDYVNLSDTHKEPQPLRSVASTQTSYDLIYDTVGKIHQRPAQITHETQITETTKKELNDFNSTHFVHEKLKLLQLSPILQNRARTRHLRQNELSYFGINTDDDTATKAKLSKPMPGRVKPAEPATRRSRSVGRAYASPVYQNLPINTLSPPVPAPRSSSSKLEKEIEESKRTVRNDTTEKYPSDDSINNLFDADERATSGSRRKATRVLETINELKIATQGSVRNSGSTKKGSNADTKHKPSPNVVRVEATSRRSGNKISNKESVTRSRESSLEDVGQLTPVQLRKSKKVDASGVTKSHRGDSISSIKKRENSKEYKIKHNVSEQKHEGCSTISLKATDSLTKSRSQTKPECSKEKSLQREHSNDKRSYSRKESEDRVPSPSKDKHSKQTEANVNEEVIRRRPSQTKPYEETIKQRSRKKEYVLNYDDKNGTLSSVSRAQPKHSSSRKHDRGVGILGNIEEKPRESTRKSRVSTFEVKNPMLLKKELHRRTKSADHRSPRRKPREEPSR